MLSEGQERAIELLSEHCAQRPIPEHVSKSASPRPSVPQVAGLPQPLCLLVPVRLSSVRFKLLFSRHTDEQV